MPEIRAEIRDECQELQNKVAHDGVEGVGAATPECAGGKPSVFCEEKYKL